MAVLTPRVRFAWLSRCVWTDVENDRIHRSTGIGLLRSRLPIFVVHGTVLLQLDYDGYRALAIR
jgi:hypothetical protein